MKTITKRFIAYALTAVMLLSAAGCSSEHRSSVNSHNAAVEPVATVAEAELSARGIDAAAGEGFYTNDVAAEMYYDEGGAEFQSSQSAQSGNATVTQAQSADRMLIRNVSVQCETLNFADLTNNIESQVTALGGYIESKSFYGTGNAGDLRYASYTIRVTSEALDQLVNTIGNAAIITGSNESTEDVTLSYTDMQARVESLRIEQDTLNDLLAQADSLDTILVLQNELTNIRYQIESYESQMRVLENLSSFSTLNLTISEVLEETPVEEAHVKTYSEKFSEAFHDGLDNAKEAFEDLGLYIAEHAIGLAVKFVILVVLVIVIVVNVKKYRRKAAAKKAAASKPSEEKTEDKK